MRYGYDLNNPLEREMYFKKHERDLQRMLNKGEDINKNFTLNVKTENCVTSTTTRH